MRLPLNADTAVNPPAGGPTLLAKVAAAAASLAALPSERSFDEQLLDTLSSSFAADSATIVTRHEAFNLQVRSAKSQHGFVYVPAQLVYQALDEYAAVAVPWVRIPRTEADPHALAGCAFLCVPMGPPSARTCVVCLRTSRAGFSEDDVHALAALVQLAESIKALSRRLDRFQRLYEAEADGRERNTMLIGDSQASRSLITRIVEIAPLTTPLLIRVLATACPASRARRGVADDGSAQRRLIGTRLRDARLACKPLAASAADEPDSRAGYQIR